MKDTFVIKAFIFLIIILFVNLTKSFSQSTNTTTQRDTVLFTDFLSNKNDTISVKYKLQLFEFFKVVKCLSGNIYFSGDGFNSVTVMQCNGNVSNLKISFEKCVSASKIILENCSFFRDGGQKPIIINKIITFK